MQVSTFTGASEENVQQMCKEVPGSKTSDNPGSDWNTAVATRFQRRFQVDLKLQPANWLPA